MAAPEIIVGSPYYVYRAPVGTAFPAIATAPAVDWRQLGTNQRNMAEEGVSVALNQTVNEYYTFESTYPVKVGRSRESIVVSFVLHDLTVEEVADLIGNTMTETPGSPDEKSVILKRGAVVQTYAWLIRGVSPYEDNLYAQYEIYEGAVTGSPTITYGKTEMAGLAFEIMALENSSGVAVYRAGAEPVT